MLIIISFLTIIKTVLQYCPDFLQSDKIGLLFSLALNWLVKFELFITGKILKADSRQRA